MKINQVIFSRSQTESTFIIVKVNQRSRIKREVKDDVRGS